MSQLAPYACGARRIRQGFETWHNSRICRDN
jgi:hypothetical protein